MEAIHALSASLSRLRLHSDVCRTLLLCPASFPLQRLHNIFVFPSTLIAPLDNNANLNNLMSLNISDSYFQFFKFLYAKYYFCIASCLFRRPLNVGGMSLSILRQMRLHRTLLLVAIKILLCEWLRDIKSVRIFVVTSIWVRPNVWQQLQYKESLNFSDIQAWNYLNTHSNGYEANMLATDLPKGNQNVMARSASARNMDVMCARSQTRRSGVKVACVGDCAKKHRRDQ